MRSIARDGVHELEISRSRFICRIARVSTADAAAEVVAAARKEHWSARHHCSAFRIGPDADQQRSSDDGEPGGTAGVPMLEVLIRRELTDTVAVVSRYFGGIKLGAGGLVRAYSRAVTEAVDMVGTVRQAPHSVVEVTIEHTHAGRLQHDLRGAGFVIAGTHYDADVRLVLHIPTDQVPAFDGWLAEHAGGRADAVVGEQVLLDVLDRPAE